MLMIARLALLVTASLLALADPLFAQEERSEEASAGMVRVVLVDGSSVIGAILSESDTTIVVMASSGVETRIPRDRIRSIESLHGLRFYRADPNRSRLLFGPTGRSLGKGSGYVAAYQIFFPFVAYGPGGGVTLAGGVSLIPGLGGQVVYLAPKITVYEEGQTSIAGGVLVSWFVGSNLDADDDLPMFGLVYAAATYGGSESWLSAGLAFGFVDADFGENPGIMVGGELQVSNSVKLLSENYVLIGVDDGLVLSGGVRFFGDRLSADLALFTTPSLLSGSDGFPFFPWIGFAYNFGRQ